tara:strand:- start:974 stop:1636 length:663 start_codon:yes stop_codon:yes gene_type:complete
MNYKLNILFLLFVQVLFGQVYQWNSNDYDLSTIHKVQMDSNYFIETIYQNNPPKFLTTRGGFYESNDNLLIIKLEFNSNYKNDSIINLEYVLPEKAKIVVSSKLELDGKWLMAGRVNAEGEERRRDLNRSRKTLKFLTNGFFQWTAFNTETFQFFGCGGGEYSAKEGDYKESIVYFSRDNSRTGQTLSFKYDQKDNDWHHTGFSSKGKPLHEIWTLRIKE